MKKTFLFIFLWACIMTIRGVVAQEATKWSFRVDPELGGDVIIKSADYEVLGDEILKIFEVESLKDGEYYVDGWLTTPIVGDNFSELEIAINGLKSEFSFKPQVGGWQSSALTDNELNLAKIKLLKGINSISVIGKGPLIPNVDFIKLSLNLKDRGISDEKYRNFIEKVKTNTLYDNSEAVSGSNSVGLRATNGEIYDYALNMIAPYTSFYLFSFSGGQSVNISTNASGSFSHVIDFVKVDDTAYSWSVVATGNGSLNVTTPSQGTYMLRLRTLWKGSGLNS